MELCSSGHDEVCYTGKNCPVCYYIDECRASDQAIRDLESKVTRLENDLAEAQNHD